MKTTICTLSALAIAATFSFAQDKPQGPGEGKGDGKGRMRPPPEEIFKKLDANADGAMTLDEFKAGPMGKKDPVKAEEIYKKIDADGNGSVTLEEYKAHKPPHRKGGPGGPGPGGAGGALRFLQRQPRAALAGGQPAGLQPGLGRWQAF